MHRPPSFSRRSDHARRRPDPQLINLGLPIPSLPIVGPLLTALIGGPSPTPTHATPPPPPPPPPPPSPSSPPPSTPPPPQPVPPVVQPEPVAAPPAEVPSKPLPASVPAAPNPPNASPGTKPSGAANTTIHPGTVDLVGGNTHTQVDSDGTAGALPVLNAGAAAAASLPLADGITPAQQISPGGTLSSPNHASTASVGDAGLGTRPDSGTTPGISPGLPNVQSTPAASRPHSLTAVLVVVVVGSFVAGGLLIFLLRRRLRQHRWRNAMFSSSQSSQIYEDRDSSSDARSSWSSFATTMDRSTAISPVVFRDAETPPLPTMSEANRSILSTQISNLDLARLNGTDTSSNAPSTVYHDAQSFSPSTASFQDAQSSPVREFKTLPLLQLPSGGSSTSIPSVLTYRSSPIEIPNSYFRLSKGPIPPLPPLPSSPPPVPYSNPFADNNPFDDPRAKG